VIYRVDTAIDTFLKQCVGWVEPFRETHHLCKFQSMGIASLHPSYALRW
jgi:hypothetical protein